MKHWLSGGLGFIVIVCLVLSLVGYLGEWHYLLDLASHFKVQYLVISLLTLLFAGLIRRSEWGFLSLVCVGLNLTAIAPWYLPHSQPATSPPHSLRVLAINVYIKNRNYAPTINLIREENPDLVAVIEVNQNWLQALQSIEDILPYSLQSPRTELSSGIALYSKFPLTPEAIETFETPKDYHLGATLMQDGRRLAVVALHPPPPIRATLFDYRNRELEAIGQYVQTLGDPVVVMGDLNITMWSPNYQKFIEISRLNNTRKGFGVLPTWNTYHPLLYIPIDHCLVSSDIHVLYTKTGKNVGSDHLPVIAELAY